MKRGERGEERGSKNGLKRERREGRGEERREKRRERTNPDLNFLIGDAWGVIILVTYVSHVCIRVRGSYQLFEI